MREDLVGRDLRVVHSLADIADRITARAFRMGETLPHDTKPDGSLVTIHDLDVERQIAKEIARVLPDDAVVGEEIGVRGRAPRQWVLDGIDGTFRFVHGDPRWSTIIALMSDDRPVVGVSSAPAQARRWWASRETLAVAAVLEPDDLGSSRRVKVSDTADWPEAKVTCIPAWERLRAEERTLFTSILGEGHYVEPVTHGAKMVACGEADACLQLRGQLWDYAALALIVERAGGLVTSLTSPHRLDHGGPMLFMNGRLPRPAF